MFNISGFGLLATVTASKTFPSGVTIDNFADDADALDHPNFQLAETGFGLNGDMVVWSKAGGIDVTLNIIPTSPSDLNLEILGEANRVGKRKKSARDTIDLVVTYPDGRVITASEGVMITTTLMPSIAAAGREKSRPYTFRFERFASTQPPAA